MVDPARGFFGTGGNASFEGITQIVKIPHLRNKYAKVGMFGVPKSELLPTPDKPLIRAIRSAASASCMTASVDTVFRFLTAVVFRPQIDVGFPIFNTNGTRRDVEQFLLAFDSDLAPIVGQQVTLTNANGSTAGPRIDLLIQRAERRSSRKRWAAR